LPYFEDNPLQKLALHAGEPEAVLDLRGLTADQAMHAVEELLHATVSAKTYLIRFDPAAGDGRETLFQPLGHRLLQARREGRLSQCLPGTDGAGYFISLAD